MKKHKVLKYCLLIIAVVSFFLFAVCEGFLRYALMPAEYQVR